MRAFIWVRGVAISIGRVCVCVCVYCMVSRQADVDV